MKDDIRRLPDSELEVMQALWQCPAPARARDIDDVLRPGRALAQTTLLTLLTRLSDKGFVAIEKQGRGSVYTPLVSREEYQAAQSRRFVDKLFGGSISAFASALSSGGLSKEELEELRELLEENRL